MIMPALGVAQDTGRVLRWFLAEGDTVSKGQPLIEIETDKVVVVLEAPADGTLAAVVAHAGDDAPVGSVIALILAPGEERPEAAPRASTPRRAPASPVARRMAREAGVDLDALAGRLGRPVQARDVQEVTANGDVTPQAVPAASAPSSPVAGGSVVPVSHLWRTMAERTATSWTTTPHFTLQREVDATNMLSWQRSARARLRLRITITDLLVRATADALRRHPAFNRSWADGGLSAHASIGIGLAVALDDGLVVPVIHDPDTHQLTAISSRRQEIVARAREGRLEPADVQGGTFTISNLGMFGVDAFSAIINAPQAAILAVGRIADRVLPRGNVPTVRPAMTLILSCDHRVVDGARAAAFLQGLAETLEEPAGLIA
jgi:pyruvate dehydrogenase E2 component (dihydrolipoamide acetyltransferase)